uniref:hypothetical protein n=1 Tax=Candidatus Cryptobacteroides bacterium TaxID=3085639 RepID=UPI00402698E8
MSMYEWAEQECRIACKKENPDFNFDSEDFDYGCSCYKSALKAYKSLCEDGHSGTSFNFTRRILERLMSGNPLTPITDEDFLLHPEGPVDSDEWLAKQGLKSNIQCPRMSSLFRRETLDGKVSYSDINRAYCINIEDPSDTYFSAETKVVDEFFPITMPYIPENGKYKVYCQTFLTDVKNGDYDTRAILYFITPDGKRIDVSRYQTEKDGKMGNITKEEYEALLEKRIGRLCDKVADSLLWTLLSNSAPEKEVERRETAWKRLLPKTKKSIEDKLKQLCAFYENPEHYKYNTFSIHQKLCKGKIDSFKGVDELVAIGEFLQNILKILE